MNREQCWPMLGLAVAWMVGGPIATVLIVSVIAYLISKLAFARKPRSVWAENFVVVDKDGKVRAELVTYYESGNPYLRFSDEKGNDSARFDRSSLSFMDKEGTLRTYLGLGDGRNRTKKFVRPSEDVSGLYLYGQDSQDSFGEASAELQVRDNGRPSLSLNIDGVARADLNPTFLVLGLSKNDDKDIPEQHVGIYAHTTAGPTPTLNKDGVARADLNPTSLKLSEDIPKPAANSEETVEEELQLSENDKDTEEIDRRLAALPKRRTIYLGTGTTPTGPELSLNKEDGSAVRLSTGPDWRGSNEGPYLHFRAKDLNSVELFASRCESRLQEIHKVAGLEIRGEGGSWVQLCDLCGKPYAALGVLFDKQGNVIWQAP